ncbi:FapA family protein [Cohnella rhizosphaerae]|uniref:FapA family protein n=1 Tax=Cohnella rhizosphaerae TaxID=1457232 RepID=A0A9X4KRR7_9BACL|nr:FapA family protein [Cohnella rhizosphaerae]MDG0809478.1 FapA family protein [Cohnella rhizosphaerae]
MQISILPKLSIGDDVNLETGNIRYAGDVEIGGSVQDQMCVEAQGNILVRGNVNSAKVGAGASIIVRSNIIGSVVTAGVGNLLQSEIHDMLGGIVPQMRQMDAAIRQLQSSSAFKTSTLSRTGLGPLINIICESRFKSFPALWKAFMQKLEEGEAAKEGLLEPDLLNFGRRISNVFLHPQAAGFDDVDAFGTAVDEAEQLYRHTEAGDYNELHFIQSGFIQNSEVYSSGDIVVSGLGIYQSKLRARGGVRVTGSVRGGEIVAAKSVTVGEAGSRGAVHTKIAVPAEESIRIVKAMEDTIIQVGAAVHRFSKTSTDVHARLDRTGMLIFE